MVFAGLICYLPYAYCGDPPGTAYSQPNASGGYDFFDSSGSKIGSSSLRVDGGYDYYDQYGNKTGSLILDEESNTYKYLDADDLERGEVTIEPYGGYRYYEQKEGLETPAKAQIRRDYDYSSPYGTGIETLPPEVIKGEDYVPEEIEGSGLETTWQSSEIPVYEESSSVEAVADVLGIDASLEGTGLETTTTGTGLETTPSGGTGLETPSYE
jgi:hypothetical protein